MSEIELKLQLLKKCQIMIAERKQSILHNLKQIEESLFSETKSSAGDKHETGRAMLQIERENTGKQLSQVQAIEVILIRIQLQKTDRVSLGSVVMTSGGNYFLSVPTGEIILDKTTYYAIGVGAPIGKLLLGKAVGEEVRFRESVLTIQKIF